MKSAEQWASELGVEEYSQRPRISVDEVKAIQDDARDELLEQIKAKEIRLPRQYDDRMVY